MVLIARDGQRKRQKAMTADLSLPSIQHRVFQRMFWPSVKRNSAKTRICFLTLGELELGAGCLLAVFLAFLNARVAGQQAGAFQRQTILGAYLE